MNEFSKQDIIEILKSDDHNDWLFDYADKTRKKYVGDEVHLRGLIEFSNICRCQCKYCGLRISSCGITEWRMRLRAICSSLLVLSSTNTIL